LLAGLINAAKVVGKELTNLRVVINGAGAAGTAIARLLRCVGHETGSCVSVADVLVCDSKGIIHRERENLAPYKTELLKYTNHNNRVGNLQDAIAGTDVFIGVSKGNILSADDIGLMADDSIILAMANPIPEIMPNDAFRGGATVVGTGRSDFPNQVNNVLAFPGIFRGVLDSRAPRVTEEMKLAAAHALAACVESPTPGQILPDVLDRSVAPRVASAVCGTCDDGTGRIS
jgi:malate dehydrogenase (oxaloacetate-decarboxylating)